MLEAMFKGVTVGEAMNKNPNRVPANISLQKLVDELMLPYRRCRERNSQA